MRLPSLSNFGCLPSKAGGSLQGTSYKHIFEALRSELAIQYIEQNNMPISEITYLLGFSDTSNFTRAFRRWTGQSPSDFGARKSVL